MNKIVIIGVGLIGGSIGLDVKRLKLAGEVVGVVRREEAVNECVKAGVVDRATMDIDEAVSGADMVILAIPIAETARIAESLKIGKDTIVIDIASVKGGLVEKMDGILGKNYVATHPIAGSEKKGVTSAREKLFEGNACIITPTENTRPKFLKIVREFWRNLGARIVVLSPGQHDKIIAAVSHLPHIVAACLVNAVSDIPKCPVCVGPGFRDSTRIASSPPELWKEICEWNKTEILSSIEKFNRELIILKNSIEQDDWDVFLGKLKQSKQIRDSL